MNKPGNKAKGGLCCQPAVTICKGWKVLILLEEWFILTFIA